MSTTSRSPAKHRITRRDQRRSPLAAGVVTPAARVQAAIECLDLIAAAAREGGAAADTVVARYFASRRYAGSKDRRAVRDLVYRRRPPHRRLPGERARRADRLCPRRRARPARAVRQRRPCAARARRPASRRRRRRWLRRGCSTELRARFGDATDAQAAALLGRAPLDLRVNTLKATRDAVALDGAVPTPLRARWTAADGAGRRRGERRLPRRPDRDPGRGQPARRRGLRGARRT